MNKLESLNYPKRDIDSASAPADGALRRALVAFRIWRTRRAVARELRALPDWARRDIGLEAAQIPEIAAAIARRELATGVAPRHLQEIAPGRSPELAGCG